MGVTEHPLQKSQLLKFYLLFVRVYRGKKLKLLKVFQQFFMKSHIMIVKTLSEHIIMVILNFWAKNVVFEQK